MNTTVNSPILQPLLFSQEDLGNCFLRPPSEREVEFHNLYCCILELLSPEEIIALRFKRTKGRKGFDLTSILGIMVLKLHYQLRTMKDALMTLEENANLRYILGLDKVPAESTTSVAFKRIESIVDIQAMHGKLVEAYKQVTEKSIVEHLSIDSSIIGAREKPVTSKQSLKRAKPLSKRGRKRKGSAEQAEYLKQKAKEEELKEQYFVENPYVSLDNLEKRCSLTAKLNSKGKRQWFIGYKAHIASDDHGVPLAFAVTGASVHDSRCAIPLAKIVKQRLFFIMYVLGDKAYKSAQILEFFERFTQAQLIVEPKRNSKYEMSSHSAERYKNRTTVERTNAELKESYLPPVMYRKGSQARFEISLSILLTTIKMVGRVMQKKNTEAQVA